MYTVHGISLEAYWEFQLIFHSIRARHGTNILFSVYILHVVHALFYWCSSIHFMMLHREILNIVFQTTFFSVLFILCLGMILFYKGNVLFSYSGIHSANLQFAGALLATLSWVSVYIIIYIPLSRLYSRVIKVIQFLPVYIFIITR